MRLVEYLCIASTDCKDEQREHWPQLVTSTPFERADFSDVYPVPSAPQTLFVLKCHWSFVSIAGWSLATIG